MAKTEKTTTPTEHVQMLPVDLANLNLLNERVKSAQLNLQNAQLNLQLAQLNHAKFTNALRDHYSENGKYMLVGNVSDDGVIQRARKNPPAKAMDEDVVEGEIVAEDSEPEKQVNLFVDTEALESREAE